MKSSSSNTASALTGIADPLAIKAAMYPAHSDAIAPVSNRAICMPSENVMGFSAAA